jgi:cytochrome c-type biogenesis protein CcmH/NrfF
MIYYWLVPIILVALIAMALFLYSSRRKIEAAASEKEGNTEAIRRGRHLND